MKQTNLHHPCTVFCSSFCSKYKAMIEGGVSKTNCLLSWGIICQQILRRSQNKCEAHNQIGTFAEILLGMLMPTARAYIHIFVYSSIIIDIGKISLDFCGFVLVILLFDNQLLNQNNFLF